MQTVIIVIHLMIVLALVGLVLLQKSEGGGLGMGGGGGGFMSSRGTTNVLSRATAILGALFFATSLLLSILAGSGTAQRSILGGGSSAPATGQPAVPGPAGSGNGVLDRLQGPPPAAPSTPAPAPSGPQVPRSD
jgi:preprotein translocase subunit SecG